MHIQQRRKSSSGLPAASALAGSAAIHSRAQLQQHDAGKQCRPQSVLTAGRVTRLAAIGAFYLVAVRALSFLILLTSARPHHIGIQLMQ